MIDFAKTIKEYRMIKLLTQEEFAALVGVATTTVVRWEKGQYEPTMQKKKQLKLLFIKANLVTE